MWRWRKFGPKNRERKRLSISAASHKISSNPSHGSSDWDFLLVFFYKSPSITNYKGFSTNKKTYVISILGLPTLKVWTFIYKVIKNLNKSLINVWQDIFLNNCTLSCDLSCSHFIFGLSLRQSLDRKLNWSRQIEKKEGTFHLFSPRAAALSYTA